MKTVAARSTGPTAATQNARARLLVKKPLDSIEHRVLVGISLGRRGGGAWSGGTHVLPHAVVLLPALERIVQAAPLPLGGAFLHEPAHLPRHRLGEAADVVAILPPEVERDEHR